jgi:catechol 2,3-dioxygenase-like lactoylglutathione lyase family enzyme
MLKLGTVNVWVNDQDEALAFYTEKVGFEVRQDVTVPEMNNFRWLTVGPPGQDVDFVLMTIPPEPIFIKETQDQIRALMQKGVTGGCFFVTDDCQGAYDELKGRGVEFNQEPTRQPYGIDASFKDPSGNTFRIAQLD